MKRLSQLLVSIILCTAAMAEEPIAYVKMRAVVDPQDPKHERTAYFATYHSNVNYKLPNGVSTYTVYYGADGTWNFTWGYSSGTVLANDPQVLYTTSYQLEHEAPELKERLSSDGKYLTIPLYTGGPDFPTETFKQKNKNDLEGTIEATDITQTQGYDPEKYYYYALQLHHKDGQCSSKGVVNELCPHIGFFWMNSQGTGFTNGANKAYLRVAKSRFASSARMQGFSFWDVLDTETGVSSILSTPSSQEGKFIKNGKVVIVKNGQKYNVNGIRQ